MTFRDFMYFAAISYVIHSNDKSLSKIINKDIDPCNMLPTIEHDTVLLSLRIDMVLLPWGLIRMVYKTF